MNKQPFFEKSARPFAIVLASILTTFVWILFPASAARAQSPTLIYIPVALAPLQRDLPLELTALTLDADLSENGGRTILSGNSTFKIHNMDTANDLQVAVGFPAWANDPYAFDPAKLGNFTVTIDGQKVKSLNPAKADLKIGSAVRSVDWYTFTLAITADEKRTVRIDFDQDLGDSTMPKFTYGLVTGQGWKGNVGSARLTINLPEMTTLDQIIATDPTNAEFNGISITWRFLEYEPTINPSLIILRQSVWGDLNNRRRAVQQAPNDANAHATLGNILRSFAAMDSPRRDSFSSQAIAELETAVRLDPNQRTARQALATLYESRAGIATGPRDANYVLLAVKNWEVIAGNDANIRKQLAEDYFYLGLDAQSRQAFGDASTYYDKAQSLMPNGAGPLYTSDRLAAQRKSLNIAWARDLLDQNNFALARDKARAALGDKFVTSFAAPPFYVENSQVVMSAETRTMSFKLVPVSATPAEMKNTVSGVAAALIAVGAATTFDDAASMLNIEIPFHNQLDLLTRLGVIVKLIPNNPEWAMVRATLSPQQLDWQEADEWISHVTRYDEKVDLSPACRAVTPQVDVIAAPLTSLDSASASDAEAQLKRALYKYAQSGWQNAFAKGRVTYRLGDNESRVDACATRPVALSTSEYIPLRVGLGIAIIEMIGVGILIWRFARRKKKAE